MSKSTIAVALGPNVPIVPVRSFDRLRLTDDQWRQVWSVCGPSVERNMTAGIPLWKVIASAYIEGLDHGAGLSKED